MRARSYIPLGIAAWLAACAESTGPPVPQSPLVRSDGQLHHLKWQSTTGRREFRVDGERGRPQLAQGAQSGPVLDRHQVSFWAFPSRDQSIQINYQASDGTWRPYVRFSVPKQSLSRWPNGKLIAKGDSVSITVSIDTTTLIVHFEPAGLAFSWVAPAQLTVWYTGADPDFDASGTVDQRDRYIEQRLLRMWVQQNAGNPWSALGATQSVSSKTFTGSLNHFSGYALSW